MFEHIIEAGHESEAAGLMALGHSRQRDSNLPTPRFFSRTIITTLRNGEDVVIQFRLGSLDLEPYEVARRALGAVVPDIKVIQDEDLEHEGISVYWMTCIPSKTWHDGARGRFLQTLVTTNRSLGRVLSKGYVDGSSELVVDCKLRPHLALLLSSEDARIRPFHGVARDLLGKVDRLKVLPLFVAHFDLNGVNIMVDDNCEVSGLVDWELSTPLPFGMGFSRIHTIAGEFSEQKFHMPSQFEDAERGFWQEICDGISLNVRELFYAQPETVQIAVTLGSLLDTFHMEGGDIGPYSPIS